MIRVLHGDCRDVLPTLAANSVHCCVTSPPYYALRDYNVAGQIGLEATPEESATTGWSAGCRCDAPTQPCTVLDCFAGAGTTMLVADRLQRHAIGIELSEAYAAMARARIYADAPLLAEVAD